MGKSKTLMVFHEKHGDEFFIAENKEDMNKIALKVLRERYNDTIQSRYPKRDQLEANKNEDKRTLQKVTNPAVFAWEAAGDDFLRHFSEDGKEKLLMQKEEYDHNLSVVEDKYNEDIAFLNSLEVLLPLPVEEAAAATVMLNNGRRVYLAYHLLEKRADANHAYEQFSVESANDY